MATASAGVTTLPGLQVSTHGSRIGNLKVYDVTFNPASVGAATSAEQTTTVTGLRSDDIPIAFVKPTATAGLGIVGVRVSAANTLAVTFMNATAGALDAGSEAYKLIVINVDTN